MAFADGTADFRSDTVTRPTTAMRRAMAEAEVGDDVYGEDPTVNALEAESAEVVGKEAAVFVASGTMGNQLALWCHTKPGSEVVCVETAHIRDNERGAGAAIAGVQFRGIASPDGRILPEQLLAEIDPSHHRPRPSLLAWENSHNVSGGTITPQDVIVETSAVARDRLGLPVHLDGARFFNAVIAAGLSPAVAAEPVDTIQFCFSKGLGAPVGSILCGPAEFIAEARYRRKMLGGGMRQVGVVAAAARIALAERDRLATDHALARRLAEGLAERFPGSVDPATVETNMVIADGSALPGGVSPAIEALEAAGVRVAEYPPGSIRFVTHRDVDDADVDRLLAALTPLAAAVS
ncbi:MAG: GntG family PLP-dependent aldolase [Acidimicrobiia bacterium]